MDDDVDVMLAEVPTNSSFIQQIKFLSAGRKNRISFVESLGKVSSDETSPRLSTKRIRSFLPADMNLICWMNRLFADTSVKITSMSLSTQPRLQVTATQSQFQILP